MKLRNIYLLLCVLGTLLPYTQFVPFLLAYGLDLSGFSQQMFANYIAGFFSLDVIASSIVLWIFVFAEGRRLGVQKLWLPVVANLTVGVSLGLPLFLYMRQAKLDRAA
jgi:hypothetical protein